MAENSMVVFCRFFNQPTPQLLNTSSSLPTAAWHVVHGDTSQKRRHPQTRNQDLQTNNSAKQNKGRRPKSRKVNKKNQSKFKYELSVQNKIKRIKINSNKSASKLTMVMTKSLKASSKSNTWSGESKRLKDWKRFVEESKRVAHGCRHR